MQKLSHDLRETLSPSYLSVLSCTLSILPRKIPAPALTALLGTLSALFKYILLPSADPHSDLSLYDATWAEITVVLSKCLPEVQRATAEAWASAVRRMKSHARDYVVQKMCIDAETTPEAVAWVMVYACKVRLSNLGKCSAAYIGCSPSRSLYTLQPHRSCQLPYVGMFLKAGSMGQESCCGGF